MLAILPVPLAGKPTDGLLLVQAKVVPLTLPLNNTGKDWLPTHKFWLEGSTTFGVGFTVMEVELAV